MQTQQNPYLVKNQSAEAVSKWTQMLDLTDKGFKAAILNTLRELKEIIIEELKQKYNYN